MALPSSVVHYTSLEVMYKILNGALESNDGKITLHLSHLTMMNDSGEGKYLLDRFYTDSLSKNNLKEKWNNDFYPTHIPFILSTIATDIKSRNRGSLPMWKMYGDDCRGVLLRFNRLKLRNYCNDNNMIFTPCKYMTVEEVSTLISQFNKKGVSFEDLMRESCTVKQVCWSYENEWRIIAYSSKERIKEKSTSRGLVEYIELSFPIDLIEEICLGPLSKEDNTIEPILSLKEQLTKKHGEKAHFKISQSSIPLK